MPTISRNVRLFMGGLALVALAGGALLAVRQAYTGPPHCRSCHAVQTELWMDSGPHNTETSCTDCHGSHQGLVPATVNVFKHYRDEMLPTHVQASDQVMSANCLACHADVLGDSSLTAGIVLMNHRTHWGEGMACVDCHRNISHDQMAGRTYRPAKKTCYECHLRDIDVGSPQDRSCANCHRAVLSRNAKTISERS